MNVCCFQHRNLYLNTMYISCDNILKLHKNIIKKLIKITFKLSDFQLKYMIHLMSLSKSKYSNVFKYGDVINIFKSNKYKL